MLRIFNQLQPTQFKILNPNFAYVGEGVSKAIFRCWYRCVVIITLPWHLFLQGAHVCINCLSVFFSLLQLIDGTIILTSRLVPQKK